MMIADFNPIALDLGVIQIHWYALAYLTGFLGGWAYLRSLIKSGKALLTLEQLDDFLSWAIAGVLLGGRLGYILFYNFDQYTAHPLHVFYLWEGGMSFHGGFVGIMAAILLFARKHKISPFHLGDLIAAAGPIGLLFGRITNFINGELYGRVTDVSWGVIFPRAHDNLPRHPSQLYEAGLEGLLLFTLLWALITYTPVLKKKGCIAGVFIIGYALSRILVEFVREPDAQLGFLYAGATMGQLLSLPMIAFGLWLIYRSFRQSK